ncbi:MAG TPA: 4Fe-4S binding protein [bacterium]|nr:4Fe-4S binding protein [bacterium]
MKREIIKIDQNKCTGCGKCIPSCPEGALQLIDGKARLVSDLYCDGLGACIGDCPEDAITIEKREAEPYDEAKVMENIIKQGKNTIIAHLKHLEDHGETEYLDQAKKFLIKRGISVPEYRKGQGMQDNCNCPGSETKTIENKTNIDKSKNNSQLELKLNNWPVQMHLINPNASYFENAYLLLSADCVPFSYSDFHKTFVKDRIVITLCPKLDNAAEKYIEKLASIIKNNTINSITIAKMEVPCCKGTEIIAREAIERSGKIVSMSTYTVSIDGSIKI